MGQSKVHAATQRTQSLEQRFGAELALVRLETDAAEAAMRKKLSAHAQLTGACLFVCGANLCVCHSVKVLRMRAITGMHSQQAGWCARLETPCRVSILSWSALACMHMLA